MKTLFILGNGFDLNLGLNTKYSDFYTYYQEKQSPNENVKKLKAEIRENIDNWSSLEEELGFYTNNFSSSNDYEEIRDDLMIHLSNYLSEQQNKLDYNQANLYSLYNDLFQPQLYLKNADKESIKRHLEKWANESVKISVMTFNYTDVLEKLLKQNPNDFNMPGFGQRIVTLKRIAHVHGDITSRMIIGVNDIQQIKNENLRTDEGFINAFVKPISNKVSKDLVDRDCIEMISDANLITIFGSSIGKTDKIWWELICQQLKKDCRLIIFRKEPTYYPLKPESFWKIERETKSQFISNTNLTDVEQESILDKIHVGVNAEIFSKLNTPLLS